MSRLILLIWAILIVFLASCSIDIATSALTGTPTGAFPEQPTVTVTIIPSRQAEPSISNTETITNMPAPIHTPSVTSEQMIDLQEHTLEISEERAKYEIDARIVFWGSYQENTLVQEPSFIWDIGMDQRWPLEKQEDEAISGVQISPDHRRLAYKISNSSSLASTIITTDAEGKVLSNRRVSDQFGGIIGWYDANILIIEWVDLIVEGDVVYIDMPSPLVLFDPVSGEEIRKLSIRDYPDAYGYLPEYSWGELALSVASYNFDKNVVIYKKGNRGIAMWDLYNQKELFQIDTQDPYSDGPRWSPDSEEIAIDMSMELENNKIQEELYIVNMEGKVTRLTDFGAQYSHVKISSYHWSPNGENIAFWVNLNENSRFYHLAVVDRVSGKITLFKNITAVSKFLGPIEKPVWMPNNRELFVTNAIDESNYQVLWIDLSADLGVVIEENSIPLGWMTGMP